jgi:hypothetical protein
LREMRHARNARESAGSLPGFHSDAAPR